MGGQVGARPVEPLPLAAVLGVRDRRTKHPVRHRLAVDVGLELGLEGGDFLAVLLGEVPEVPLAGEPPQLTHASVAVDRLTEGLRPLELRQVLVALVNRLELEPVLQTGKVEVVLLVELGDEAVGVLAVALELLRAGRGARHRP